jgi:sacsin
MSDGSDSCDSDSESFGQRPPPLCVFLSSVLEKYPDGSQLKELLQNADDANASEVKFILDERSYSTETLANPSLARFQGPALLAYNDEIFKSTDWDSITKPAQSKKLDNLTKTGRFGIGFNSVYHMTGAWPKNRPAKKD